MCGEAGVGWVVSTFFVVFGMFCIANGTGKYVMLDRLNLCLNPADVV